MKRILFISMLVLTFCFTGKDPAYAKYDILREVDGLVDASKPNVLLIIATDKYMTRPFDESGGVNDNTGDNATVSSRFYNVKDVLAGLTAGETGVLDLTKKVISYGLMAYDQSGYYPYFHDHEHGSDDFETSTTYKGNTASFGGSHNNLPYYYNTFTHTAGSYPAFNASPITIGVGGKLWVKIDPSGIYTQNGPGGATDSDPDEATVIKKYLALQKSGGIVMDDAPSSDARVRDAFKKTDDDDDIGDDVDHDGIDDDVDDDDDNDGIDDDDDNDDDNDGINDDDDHDDDNDGINDDVDNDDNDGDAYEYFRDGTIPQDPNSSSGCFSKNYIIYIGDGFGSNSAFSGATGSAAAYAEDLFNLTVGGENTPVKTFVIGVIDPNAAGMGNRRANLNEIARRGGTDASEPVAYGLEKTSIPTTSSCGTGGTPCNDYAFFVTNKAKLKEALLNIAATIAAGDFVTGAPTATSSGGTFVTNDVGILASSEYPEWRGHLRAVDLVNDRFLWDAGTTLFIPAADTTYFPKAVANASVADKGASWQDTDGDGVKDKPPATLTVDGVTYQYTDRVLYCETASIAACNSSKVVSYYYAGSPATFSGTSYTYKGALYLKPYSTREVYTSQLSGALLAFTAANWNAINTLAGWGVAEGYAKAIINFALGGVDTNKDGTVEYNREWWLGDITNIVPIAIGKPIDPADGLSGRGDYQTAYAARKITVYTGSNDGMFHAYDFATGNELFAYLPPNLLSTLKTLYDNAMTASNPESYTGQMPNPTDHIYGISASPRANDVYFDSDSKWHTVVVSGEGPGGKHYFSLDVTHPNGSTDYTGATAWATERRYSSADTGATDRFKLLWNTQQDATAANNLAGTYSTTMGESWSLPAFGRLQVNNGVAPDPDAHWTLFFGSGYDDTSYADAKGETYHINSVQDGTLFRSNLELDVNGVTLAPEVQYGLLADTVSIIKKSGSLVRASYQADLYGRVWHFNTISNDKAAWTKTQLISGATLPAENPTNPFYYSPAVWDYDYEVDDALNLMVLGSGSYEDAANDARRTKIYFCIINPATPAFTDVISVDMNTVSGTKLDSDGNSIGTATAPALANAKLIASPVLFNNRKSGHLEALVLVFDPPAAGTLGCEFGNSYLLVFNMGSPDQYQGAGADTTFEVEAGDPMKDVKDGKAQFVVSMGTGKVSGIGIAGGGSHIVVGQSGRGRGSSSGFNMAGGDVWNPIGAIKKLYWKEY